ncbi:hypothetical protein BGZ46_003044, partial [Entomortierella lignicola]
MRTSRLLFLTLLGASFISTTVALHVNHNDPLTNIKNNNKFNNKRRDILGGLLPPAQPQPSPQPSPQPASHHASAATTSLSSDPTKSGNGQAAAVPSLIGGILDPSTTTGPNSVTKTTLPTSPSSQPGLTPKKKPNAGGTSSDNSADDGNTSDQNSGNSTNTSNRSESDSNSGLAPGLVALLVIILVAISGAVIFSCYKIRQVQRRRRESWNEDILKNHAGSVGYSEGAGYGMYVGGGGGGFSRPDLYRKNLD